MSEKVNSKKQTQKWIVIALLAFILVLSTGSFIFVKYIYDSNFPRYDNPKYSGYLRFSDINDAPTIVKFRSGENTLTGYLYGEGTSRGLVVIAPGRGEGAESYLSETVYFVEHGWRVFSFDYTGSFASEGDSTVGLPQARRDLNAALDFIGSSAGLNNLPVVLYGHSWGGYAVTAVLNDTHDVSAVASIAGFNAPVGLLAENVKSQLGVLGDVLYPAAWVYQRLRFGQDALVTAVGGINRSDIPVMIIHGTADDAIAYSGASIIARRAEITNPNVVYKTCGAENHNGHYNLYRSDAAVRYIDAKNQEYKALHHQYQGAIPDQVLADYYASVDRFQTSELDAGFIEEVILFFENALSQQSF